MLTTLDKIRLQAANKYVGTPFEYRGRKLNGADCWGLHRLFLKAEVGIEIPSFDHIDYENMSTRERIVWMARMIIDGNNPDNPWNEIPITEARFADGLLIRMLGCEIHVATVLSNNLMLHTSAGVDAIIERYDTSRWSKRIVGAYRHEALMNVL